jgi:DNA-binding response OmpR family regulator
MPTILIVEDEKSARASLGRVLVQEGYRVKYAEEGMDALVVFEDENVDLVLLDLMLPGGMDGVAFLHTLRRDRRWKHTPVLVVSSISDADFVKHIKAGGADGYFIKDQFDPADLLKEVRSHLEHAKATC